MCIKDLYVNGQALLTSILALTVSQCIPGLRCTYLLEELRLLDKEIIHFFHVKVSLGKNHFDGGGNCIVGLGLK